jgi:hypothetical protein
VKNTTWVHGNADFARVLELPTEATELLELIETGGVPGVSFVESSTYISDGGCLIGAPVWRSDGSRKHVVDPQSGLLVAVCQVPGSALQAIAVDTGLRYCTSKESVDPPYAVSYVHWPLVQPRYLPLECLGTQGRHYYLRVDAPMLEVSSVLPPPAGALLPCNN